MMGEHQESKTYELTQDVVRELLDYCPDTGVFTWKSRGSHWFVSDRACRAWNTRHAGSESGCVFHGETGYKCIKIVVLYRQRLAHRLAFLWMTGDMPSQVDHLNHDGTDNRWDNLRASGYAENSKNKSMSSKNTSGVTGVHWDKEKGRWKAYFNAGRKHRHLGYFEEDDLDIAAMEVMEARVEHGFDPSHGLDFAPYHHLEVAS